MSGPEKEPAGRDLTGSVRSVEVVDIALPNNFGVARDEGLVLFVPEAVPGDKVRIRIAKQARGFAYGEILAIEKLSPYREKPLCSHFGSCGGCSLQHLSYQRQLEIKRSYLEQTLKRIGGLDPAEVEIAPIVPSVDRQFYRGKIELAFAQKGNRVTLGLKERVSPLRPHAGEVVSLQECPLFSPVLAKVVPLFLEFIRKHGLTVYNASTQRGLLQSLVVREAKSSGDVMLNLVICGRSLPHASELAERVTALVPETRSFYWTGGNNEVLLSGKPSIEERLGGFVYRIYPRVFFQPNPKTAALLYGQIPGFCSLKGGERVIGLYCGTGPIEIALSPFVREVTGIDSERGNVAAALENCRMNGIENTLFRQSRVESLPGGMLSGVFDLAVVDPPRAGISTAGLEAIGTIGPQKLLYVSCSPPTLARDAKSLRKMGYRVKRLACFDFFPHTSHMESLALFERG